MKKNKILALVLAFCVCLPLFAACDFGSETTKQQETQGKVEETSNKGLETTEEVELDVDFAEKYPTAEAIYLELTKRGYEGTFEEWVASLAGKDGKSAYELAVENGFEGTLDDWLSSLIGKDGEKGDKGEDGSDGVDGSDGEDGLTPFIGENGNWWIGDIDTGIKAQGDKGDKGDIGETGATIDKVEFDEAGRLVITLTDGTVLAPVELPEKEEHVHSYGDPILYDSSANLYIKICCKCNEVIFVSGNNNHTLKQKYSYDKTCHWYECTLCDEQYQKEQHTINDAGVCVVCNNQITASKGVVYAVSSDGTYAEVIDYTASATHVVIADEYEGVPVTLIGTDAFRSKSIVSVFIPNSVTSIGPSAFRGCTSLENTTIPGSVINIGSQAFYNCSSLKSIELPDSVTSISDEAFRGCSNLTDITISDSVTSIGDYAFSGCKNLTSITIPDGVTSIGDYAFSDCSSLTSITTPDSVTSIGAYAFYWCTSLTSITIPDSVTSIGYRWFQGCRSLTSITIPDSVTSIGYCAFSDCSSLTSVTIPDGFTSIDNFAFSDCSSLTSIMYRGTKEQWNAIDKGYEWDRNTGNYTITYNYTGE